MRSTPARRRLVFTTPRSAKRPRLAVSTPANRFRSINRRTTKGPRTTGTLRAQVKSLQSIVKNLAPELKYVDVSVTPSNIPTTGTVVHVSAIAQGDTQSTRTGNTVNVTSVSVRGSFSGATDVSVVSYMRILLVVDKEQQADTAPTAAAVVLNANPVENLPNLDNLERFRVLYATHVYDMRRMQLDTDATTTAPTQSAFVDFTWKGNLKVSYNGNASTDMEKNNIYLVFLSDVAAATTDFSGTTRIGFTDV